MFSLQLNLNTETSPARSYLQLKCLYRAGNDSVENWLTSSLLSLLRALTRCTLAFVPTPGSWPSISSFSSSSSWASGSFPVGAGLRETNSPSSCSSSLARQQISWSSPTKRSPMSSGFLFSVQSCSFAPLCHLQKERKKSGMQLYHYVITTDKTKGMVISFVVIRGVTIYGKTIYSNTTFLQHAS